MKAKATIQLQIDTADYPGYEDSADGVRNIAMDVLIGVVTLKGDPAIVVEPETPPTPEAPLSPS